MARTGARMAGPGTVAAALAAAADLVSALAAVRAHTGAMGTNERALTDR